MRWPCWANSAFRLALFLLLLMPLGGCLVPPLPRVIKIGLVAPFEGQYRYIGYDAVYAARLAVREINAAGGVGGWQIELLAYDDRADAQLARTAAQNLVIDPDVIAVIGHYRQNSIAAAAPVYAEAELPFLVVGGWVTSSTSLAWHLSPAPEQLARAALARIPHVTDGDTVSVWGTDPLALALREEFSDREDLVLLDGSAQPAETGPAWAFSTLAPVETAEQLLLWRQLGWQGTLWGREDFAAAPFSAVAAEARVGACMLTPYLVPQDHPELAAWTTAYQSVGPHVPSPGLYALPTYEAVYVLAEALAVALDAPASKPTRESIAAALPQSARAGLFGPIRWDAAGFWQHDAVSVSCWEPDTLRAVLDP